MVLATSKEHTIDIPNQLAAKAPDQQSTEVSWWKISILAGLFFELDLNAIVLLANELLEESHYGTIARLVRQYIIHENEGTTDCKLNAAAEKALNSFQSILAIPLGVDCYANTSSGSSRDSYGITADSARLTLSNAEFDKIVNYKATLFFSSLTISALTIRCTPSLFKHQVNTDKEKMSCGVALTGLVALSILLYISISSTAKLLDNPEIYSDDKNLWDLLIHNHDMCHQSTKTRFSLNGYNITGLIPQLQSIPTTSLPPRSFTALKISAALDVLIPLSMVICTIVYEAMNINSKQKI